MTRDRDRWWQRAACADHPAPEIFFPSWGQQQVADQAKQVCATCSVQSECLAQALNNREQHGVWGGLTVRERSVLLRSRLR